MAGRLLCHVLLCETADGLVLVDSGFGLADVENPKARLGGILRHSLGAVLSEDETARRQIERMGFAVADVRHIVVTHFDADHIGGIADFPAATVHTTRAEFGAAAHPSSMRERIRFRAPQWAFGPTMELYDGPGESLLRFPTAYPLRGVAANIFLVPLPGHTRGHAAVAVDLGGEGWLVHAGDAFYHHNTLERAAVPSSREARFLGILERSIAVDRSLVRQNHRTLRDLAGDRSLRARVFNAHDRTLFEQFAGSGG
ncbi:MBL fold metallo-hydrolase [Rhodococcus sp. (in: high G+C Gram-positive bacteria)]|uniref:MBL fold metallo-hydrolase n=1 Tax=Rhodococcus sp. TaxID=1831 RepID=UPI003BB0DEC1